MLWFDTGTPAHRTCTGTETRHRPSSETSAWNGQRGAEVDSASARGVSPLRFRRCNKHFRRGKCKPCKPCKRKRKRNLCSPGLCKRFAREKEGRCLSSKAGDAGERRSKPRYRCPVSGCGAWLFCSGPSATGEQNRGTGPRAPQRSAGQSRAAPRAERELQSCVVSRGLGQTQARGLARALQPFTSGSDSQMTLNTSDRRKGTEMHRRN